MLIQLQTVLTVRCDRFTDIDSSIFPNMYVCTTVSTKKNSDFFMQELLSILNVFAIVTSAQTIWHQ